MNKQEISTFTDLYKKFQEQCKRVAEILSEYDGDFKESYYSDWWVGYKYDTAVNCCNDVDIYIRNMRIESRTLYFPIELLYANDEQIHEYAVNKYKNKNV